jgi:nucleotide-binding universal stress UspA family protein
MFQRMLVLLDGSELAEVVFPYAKELAGRLALDVILLHVFGPAGKDFAPMHRAYIDRSAATIKRQAQEVRKKLGKEAAGKPVKVQGEVIMGYHADEILTYVDEHTVDLILMATHGRSGIKRWVMGSVADKILRASKVPVWLVRAGLEEETPFDKWPSKTIIVPLDGSELAESILPLVETLAQQWGKGLMNVTLVRVCEPPVTPSYYSPELSGVPLNWGEFMEQETTRCKQTSGEYLAETAKRLSDKGISVHGEVLVGKAADEIIDFANKNPFSIIAMATQGRSGLRRLVYGSTAESVLVGVICPLILLRPQ